MKENATAKILILAFLVACAIAAIVATAAILQSRNAQNNQEPPHSHPLIPLQTSTPPPPTPTPTTTPSPTPTPLSFPTSSPTATPAPSVTPSPTPSAVPTPSPTPSPSPTPTPAPTATPTPTPTPTPSPTPTPTQTPGKMDSENWAGYAAASDQQKPQPTVTGVNGSWSVPTVTPSTNDTFSSTWIGIGGIGDNTLIQCGTEQDSINNRAEYSAWYELLPAQSTPIYTMNVSPDDKMQAQIQLLNGTVDQWTINITDTTKAESFQTTVTYNSSQLSADWIVERPTVDGNLSQLANFGNATFTNCTVTVDSTTGPIDYFPSSQIIMYSSTPGNSVQLADVSNLNPDGEEFTVTWLASG